MTRKRGQLVKTAVHMDRREWPNIRISWDILPFLLALSGKRHLNIFHLPYNAQVSEMTWPQVIEIKIPRCKFCVYWCLYQLLKVSYWYLKNCSHSEVLNIFWVRVTSPDLVTWPEMTLGWNFLEGCEIDVWKNMQKNTWCGQNDPTRAKVKPLYR